MIIESLIMAGIAFGVGIYAPVNKSMKLDEKAMQKYGRAFEKAQNARMKVDEKSALADKRAKNVVNKKRAIINHSLPQFIEVYDKIQKIQIESKEKSKIIEFSAFDNLNYITSIPIAKLENFTDKQLICGIALRGITGMMVKESEQKLSAANNTMNYARVYEAQADSFIVVYDAIIERANRIADLLLKMNILFLQSIEETNRVINKNGMDVLNYSENDKSVLATCVNIADSVFNLVDIPVVNEHGELVKEAVELIEKGQMFLDEMSDIL